MRRISILASLSILAGCSTAPTHSCGMPDLPGCVSVTQAYKASLQDIDNGHQSRVSSDYGYHPTSQPTESIEIQRKSDNDGKDVVEQVKAYIDRTKPLPLAKGVAPNGVPLAPELLSDTEQY